MNPQQQQYSNLQQGDFSTQNIHYQQPPPMVDGAQQTIPTCDNVNATFLPRRRECRCHCRLRKFFAQNEPRKFRFSMLIAFILSLILGICTVRGAFFIPCIPMVAALVVGLIAAKRQDELHFGIFIGLCFVNMLLTVLLSLSSNFIHILIGVAAFMFEFVSFVYSVRLVKKIRAEKQQSHDNIGDVFQIVSNEQSNIQDINEHIETSAPNAPEGIQYGGVDYQSQQHPSPTMYQQAMYPQSQPQPVFPQAQPQPVFTQAQPSQSLYPQPQVHQYEADIRQQPDQSSMLKYQTQLNLLAEMGFTNRSENIRLLEQYNGNLQSVVSANISNP